jgi:hypothetical protein
MPRLPYGIDLRDCSIEARRKKKVKKSLSPTHNLPVFRIFGRVTRGNRVYVKVQRLRFVVLRQGFQRGVREITIGHDTAREGDQEYE